MNHPGKELSDVLKNSGMSRKELAIRTNVTEKHIGTVINGERSISASFAKKLGYVFKDARYWMDLQLEYDEDQLKIQEENEITNEEIQILTELKNVTKYLVDNKIINNESGKVSQVIELRKFLLVSNLENIPQITYNASYRAQLAANYNINKYVLFAWQRLCEYETENIETNISVNKDLLRSKLSYIKSMMFGDINKGIEGLQKIFAACGIKFQVVRNFVGAPVQGFIKETANNNLILCLTIRGKRADTFWFTLFHEIAHILNDDYKSRFVDFNSVQNEIENRADEFAKNILIDPKKYRDFIFNDRFYKWDGIVQFAQEIQVEPFIVLGRLQNDGLLDWSSHAEKIVKYKWA